MKKNITSYFSIIILLAVLSAYSQGLKIDSKTIAVLNDTGLDFKKHKKGFVYLSIVSENLKAENTTIETSFQLLKMEDEVKIDDELPEGMYKWILSVTKPIWECHLEGTMQQVKGSLFLFQSDKICGNIPNDLIPGGDTFIPGGDQFIPGGDQFIPGGDQFNRKSKYFLKINIKSNYKITPVLLPLKID